jgi:hypothetical protein
MNPDNLYHFHFCGAALLNHLRPEGRIITFSSSILERILYTKHLQPSLARAPTIQFIQHVITNYKIKPCNTLDACSLFSIL